MKLRVLIAPDKFKGTLTAAAAAEAIRRGWRRARPQDALELLPMSDGGDGFGEIIGNLLGARVQRVRTVDAAGRPCNARWWWQPKTKTAIVESAAVIGLALLKPGAFHPFELDTFGLGALLENVAARKPRRCFLGIGGSASNDGGFGLARALGWRFFDPAGQPLQQWTELDRLSRLEPPSASLHLGELLVAVDVRNPLLGPRGASRVYGPQKGLLSKDLPLAERCLKRLAKVLQLCHLPSCHLPSHDSPPRHLPPRHLPSCHLPSGHLPSGHLPSHDSPSCHLPSGHLPSVPGAGAAGGLGFGLAAFLSARLIPGFDLFAKLSHLDERLRRCDLVITGEGALDRSTLMGKGVSQLAERCRTFHTPCLALGGIVSAKPRDLRIFSRAHALNTLTTLANALAEPAFWLQRLTAQVAASWDQAPRRGEQLWPGQFMG